MKMQKRKGYFAPVFITLLMVAYFVAYFGFLITLVPTFWKVALAILPIVFCAVLIGVCIQRINEIRSGQEDDLSQY